MDSIWPSNNPLDIPLLEENRQAIALDPPLLGWGSVSRLKTMRGTWHFYVDDYRFASLWERPEALVATQCLGVVEPNLSIYDQTPYAVAVSLTYKKRWLARYWQEQGVRVWVDLNVARCFAELNLLGVPPGWASYATRGYEERVRDLDREFALAERHSGGAPKLLVYGGGPKVRGLVDELGGIHVTDDRSVARDRYRARTRRAKAVRQHG